MKNKYISNLQGSDFNSTAGFDTLCKRVRDGKQMCIDFEEFIKQRYLPDIQYDCIITMCVEHANYYRF